MDIKDLSTIDYSVDSYGYELQLKSVKKVEPKEVTKVEYV